MKFEGARWYKFDFHTHTPASEDYGKGPNQAALKATSPRDWLLGYMGAKIDCVAVTDHNSGEWIDLLKSELAKLDAEMPAGYRELALFPGVEVSANNGIHILGIFDRTASSATIAGLLGAVSYRGNYGACAIAATASAEEIVNKIVEAGGLAILAHVDCPRGAFELNGSTLQPLLGADLSAVELVDPAFTTPDIYRKHKRKFTEVIGSDAHHPSGPSGSCFPGSKFTYVKMGRPALEGLRLALIDGSPHSVLRSDSVSNGFDPNVPPANWIRRISVSSAKLMGRGGQQNVDFSPWLTSLVGGRGTGKSSIAHFLRGAFQRSDEFDTLPKGYPPRQTYEDFIRVPASKSEQGALTDETKVSVEFEHEGSPFRIDWDAARGHHEVFEFLGGSGWVRASSQEIRRRFPISIFSQNQVNALASSDGDALLTTIDESIGNDRVKNDIDRLRLELSSLYARKREYSSQLKRADLLRAQIEDLTKRISRLEDSANAATIAEYQLRVKQEAALSSLKTKLGEQSKKLSQARESLDLDLDFLAGFPQDDLLGKDFVRAAGEILSPANTMLREAFSVAERQVGLAIELVASGPETLKLKEAVSVASDAYEELRGEIGHEVSDGPEAYSAFVVKRSEAEEDLRALEQIILQVKKIDGEIDQRRLALADARRALTIGRHEFLSSALRGNKFVRIQLHPFGRNAQVVEESLREALGVPDERFKSDIYEAKQGAQTGLVAEILRASNSGLSPSDLNAKWRAIEGSIEKVKTELIEVATTEASRFGGFFTNFLRREAEKKPETLDRIMGWYPEDSLEIEYSPSGDGRTFKPIGQASSGQKAAAMLAFLLVHGSEPIVIDQPEDDLDNSLIYDLLVQQIRSKKMERQVIAITHNPNIVVNGDAELINVFSFSGGQCRVNPSGCLQEPEIREEVCRIMEGGRDAFEKRYRRLV